jgi:DNA-binding IclR family transcriptional regulator
VLQLLDALSRSDQPLSLAQLSRQLGAPKTSLIGLLRGLAEGNFVVFIDGCYRLGGSAFELGSAMVSSRQRLHMPENIRTGMRELNKRSGETVLYAILSQDDPDTMTYLDIIESRGAIRISVTVGDRSPLYCTAGGRVLLADMADDDVCRYLDRVPLKALSETTETSKSALLEAIRQTRCDGVSTVFDEVIQGVTGMAAPVRDSSGSAIGTLIIAGPTARVLGHDEELAGVVRESAQTISLSLGHRGDA